MGIRLDIPSDFGEGILKEDRQWTDVAKANDRDTLGAGQSVDKPLDLRLREGPRQPAQAVTVRIDNATQQSRWRAIDLSRLLQARNPGQLEIDAVLDAGAEFVKVSVAKQRREAHHCSRADTRRRGQFARV